MNDYNDYTISDLLEENDVDVLDIPEDIAERIEERDLLFDSIINIILTNNNMVHDLIEMINVLDVSENLFLIEEELAQPFKALSVLMDQVYSDFFVDYRQKLYQSLHVID